MTTGGTSGMWVAVAVAPDGTLAVAGPYYQEGKAHSAAESFEARGYVRAEVIRGRRYGDDWPEVTR